MRGEFGRVDGIWERIVTAAMVTLARGRIMDGRRILHRAIEAATDVPGSWTKRAEEIRLAYAIPDIRETEHHAAPPTSAHEKQVLRRYRDECVLPAVRWRADDEWRQAIAGVCYTVAKWSTAAIL